MNLKDFLESYRLCRMNVEALRQRIEDLRFLSCGVSGGYSERRKAGSAVDKVGISAIKITEMQERLDAKIDAMLDIQQNVEALIDKLPNEKLRTIMRFRHIEGKTNEQTARDMNYSRRHITRMYKEAFGLLVPLYEEMRGDDAL